MPKPCKKTVEISPLSGPMNTRALPKEVPFGAWRWRQNLWVDASRNVGRRPGWTKFLSEIHASYNNEDLHDQGQDSGAVREDITYLWEAVSTSGDRRIIAGTNNQLFVSNLTQGTWTKIYQRATSVQAATYWQAGQVSDGVVFSNGIDPLFVWPFDTPVTIVIASLLAIGLTSARMVYSWKGVIFLGDVVMDGERIPHRLVWGDLNDPLNFEPSNTSVGGFQDLSYGERVLKGLALSDYLIVYTDRSNWQVTTVGGAQAFNFRAAYQALETGEACLAYPNTLVSTGQSHLYLGADGIYEWDMYKPKPDRVDWMHASSNIIFDTINQNVCFQHNAAYHPPTKEYLISWVPKDRGLRPERTLAYNLEAKTSDVIDHGFMAMLTHIPDLRANVTQAVSTNYPGVQSHLDTDPDSPTYNLQIGGVAGGCLCGEDEFNAIMAESFVALFPGETVAPPAGSCNDADWDCVPRFFSGFTNTTVLLEDGREVEDPEGEETGALCRFLNTNINLLDCLECATRARLILVSSTDNTLKEFGRVYYREEYTGTLTDPHGCGAYVKKNYQVIGILGPMNFDLADEMKTLSRLEMEFYAALAGTDLKLVPYIGVSDYAAEPLGPETGLAISPCPMTYKPLTLRKMLCKFHAQTHNWTMWFQGRYLTLKFVIDGVNQTVTNTTNTDVGGSVSLPVIRLELFSNAKWPEAKD